MPSPSLLPSGRPAPEHANLAYLILHMAGVVATTLLLTWGLFVLLFLMIGGFSFEGLMHQLANLSRRYVTAEPARIASFQAMLIGAHILLSGAILFFRRGTLLPARATAGSH